MSLLFWLLNIATAATVYWFWVRPILAKTPTFGALIARDNSYMSAFVSKFTGIKQRLVAAFVYMAGAVVGVHDLAAPYLANVDVKPFFPKIVSTVPAEAWPIIVVGITMLLDYFRYLADKRSQ